MADKPRKVERELTLIRDPVIYGQMPTLENYGVIILLALLILRSRLFAGYTQQQIQDLEDEIIDFAEIRNAIDLSLKTYSAGMNVWPAKGLPLCLHRQRRAMGPPAHEPEFATDGARRTDNRSKFEVPQIKPDSRVLLITMNHHNARVFAQVTSALKSFGISVMIGVCLVVQFRS